MPRSVKTNRATDAPGDGLCSVLHADVRVSHRHVHVGMAGEFFGLGQTGAVLKKAGNVGVPPCRVEVSDTFRSLVGDANPFQVFPDHEPGSSLRQLRKENLVWRDASNPLAGD